ncbi:MAG TPA: outer membrane beta-barrel protein [Chitinophagaceae bacterium]
MKRIRVIFFFLIEFSSVKAQHKIGLHAGFGLVDQYERINGLHKDPQSKFGINMGFLTDVNLTKMIFFRGELDFVTKGSKIPIVITNPNNPPDPGFDSFINSSLNYIEIPLQLGGKLILNKTNSLFLGFGPYFSVAISGKNKFYDGSSDNPFKLDESQGGYQRFDFGGKIFVDYGIQNFAINIFYTNGVKDIVGSNDFYILKNRALGLNIIYYLKKK